MEVKNVRNIRRLECKKGGADSLEFLPLEVLKSMSPDCGKFCFACMSGNYW